MWGPNYWNAAMYQAGARAQVIGANEFPHLLPPPPGNGMAPTPGAPPPQSYAGQGQGPPPGYPEGGYNGYPPQHVQQQPPPGYGYPGAGGCGAGPVPGCNVMSPMVANHLGITQGPGAPRVETITFEVDMAGVAAGSTNQGDEFPQKCFRPVKLVATTVQGGGTAASDYSFRVEIGVNPQVAGGSGFTPAAAVAENAQGVGVAYDLAWPGRRVRLIVRNDSGAVIPAGGVFRLVLWGATVDGERH